MPQASSHSATIENAEQAAAVVRDCVEKNLAIVDYGKAHRGLGNPPPAEHVQVTQRGSVIEHYVRDFTVRAAAGITLADLQKSLAAENQFAPIDADDDITLGEIINHHMYGPLRVGFGSIRDHLLGLHYIDGNGRDIHVGGRTVKNVAGYDVTRLMVGSLGQLGLIHEATLRTYARPQHVMVVDLGTKSPAALDSLMTDWLLADAAPMWMILNHSEESWRVRVGYYGSTAACNVQVQSLETMLDGTGVHIIGHGETTLEQDAAERSLRSAWRRTVTAMVKVIVPPATTGAVAESLLDAAAGLHPFQIEALPVHGVLFAGGDLDAQDVVKLDAQIRELIEPHQGCLAWQARPDGTDVQPFAPPQPDWPMIAKLKQTMDPHNLFNPGRMF